MGRATVATRVGCPLLFAREVVLICKGRPSRALDDDEAVFSALVTRIACRSELIIPSRKALEVLCIDRLLKHDDFLGNDGVEHVGERQVLEGRYVILYVRHNFLDLTELVCSERPVARLPGKPKLVVLDQNHVHELLKSGQISFW